MFSESLKPEANASEAVNTNIQKVDEASSTNTNNGGNKTGIIVELIKLISFYVSQMSRTGDAKNVAASMGKILTTVFAMCALDEHEIGLRVRGELYRYDEYNAPAVLAGLLIAKKVVARDVITATNFLNRDKYGEGLRANDLLTPSEFAIAWKTVCVRLRINPDVQPLSRPTVALIADASQYAVNGKKFPDSVQKGIYFLTQRFDQEALSSMDAWAGNFAIRITET